METELVRAAGRSGGNQITDEDSQLRELQRLSPDFLMEADDALVHERTLPQI